MLRHGDTDCQKLWNSIGYKQLDNTVEFILYLILSLLTITVYNVT